MTTTCSQPSCANPASTRGFCNAHYMRWLRGGPLEGAVRAKLPPGVNSCCVIDGCTHPAKARQLCRTHYTRWWKHGDPLVTEKTGRKPGYASESHGMWTGEEVGYHGAHKRVAKVRGQAAEHSCVDCGELAEGWAYDRADPAERASRLGPYSLDPSRYHPRCASCHKLYDVGALAAAGWTVWDKGPEVCSEGDCEQKPHARGWCRTHYNRWYSLQKGKKR